MQQVEDNLFGTLRYEFGWHGSYEFFLLGHKCDRLSIPSSECGDISREQRCAFTGFVKKKEELLVECEKAILDYYIKIHGELTERLGEEAARIAPEVFSREGLALLVRPTALLIQEPLNEGENVVGILCDCSWAPSLGLAVKLVNEHVVEVGDQDIVL